MSIIFVIAGWYGRAAGLLGRALALFRLLFYHHLRV
jgi:hypothetical protein